MNMTSQEKTTLTKDDEIPGVKIHINAIDTEVDFSKCMIIQEKQQEKMTTYNS